MHVEKSSRFAGDALFAAMQIHHPDKVQAARLALAHCAEQMDADRDAYALDKLIRADDAIIEAMAKLRQAQHDIAAAFTYIETPEKLFPVAADIAAEMNEARADDEEPCDWRDNNSGGDPK